MAPGSSAAGLQTNPARLATPPDLPGLSSALGGEWRSGCFVVERRWEPSARYGREAIGTLAQRLEEAAGDAVLYTSGTSSAPACPPFVFFDLETTGLSGGAGTQAFLVGCAWFDSAGCFVTRQFLLTQYADERAMLETVAAELANGGRSSASTASRSTRRCSRRAICFIVSRGTGRQLPHVDCCIRRRF